VAAELDVVRDVTVGQQMVVRADAGEVAIAGSIVNGDVFAKDVVVADDRAGDATLYFGVLRTEADAQKGEISFSRPMVV